MHRKYERHGLSKTPTYKSWDGIIQRCTNRNCNDYPDYGGVGVAVCDRWMIFANFLSDMGVRPRGMSIDRIDNNKGYEPGNCRWATINQQIRNRRTTTLTPDLVRTIRRLHSAGRSYRSIASETGVPYWNVASVARGRSWKDIKAEEESDGHDS